MRWFGRNRSDKKKQPLIQMVNSVGKDDEPAAPAAPAAEEAPPAEAAPQQDPPGTATAPPADANPPPTNPEAAAAAAADTPVPPVTSELDYNIPAKRVTSGEREMILPKHLKKNYDVNDDGKDAKANKQGNSELGGTDYLPFVDVPTTSQDDSHSTAVISAISLSTIGASIERELEGAKGLKGKPPLEIKANTHQSVKKKENVGYLRRNFQKATLAVKTAVVSTLPNKVVDGLASAYDTIHAPRNNKDKNLDDVPVTARKYRRDHPDLLLPGNVPRVGFTAIFAAIPLWVKYLAVGAVAAAALTGLALELENTMLGEQLFDWQEETFVDWTEEKSVAFIGNSYFFVNDVPRLVNKISGGRVHQGSCVNPGASLGRLLRAGNGMYEYWDTDNAITYKFNTEWNEDYDGEGVHDYGSCSVFQLLEGYDNDLTYMNYNGAYYYEEGMNPCFEDENYILYLNDWNLKNPSVFDYVILNDQTARMADADAREDTVDALKYAYAPMIKDSRAKPLLVDTHAYPMEAGSNETDYGESIPYMQAMIYYGVEEYLMALKYNLPSYQEPKVVPIGLAYLTVWEENHSLWSKLFLNETMPYASPYGSYLFANVIYASVYGHLPRRPTQQSQIKDFFKTARYLPELPDDWTGIFPTIQESDYLRLVARRVTLNGEIPTSFTNAKEQIELELRGGYEAEEEECVCEDSRDQEEEECEEGDDDGAGCEQEEEEENEEEEGSQECECQSQDEDMDEQENRGRRLV
ncbi:expressed unknown protein [Seminavis robusta]|uniref:Uncharacterized protein n=1 Tax=Seminavis robusta TaxID=568900 RepID=A0A9N8DYC9_9STRA|nr:expressed unknown protein [Seminavis robusta]|eukprot:Sro465_g148530.1 n/a (750) ;mRNA; f:7854-10103